MMTTTGMEHATALQRIAVVCRGYMDICKAMKNPRSKQACEYTEWLGGIYEPKDFPKKRNREK